MIFEPGNSYYVLSAGEYSEMVDLLAELELNYDLADDFELVDGKYYAKVGSSSISADELVFMEDWGFSKVLAYKKSTQSTNFY